MVAWLRLLRLPNVFTAVADVAMGYLVTHGTLRPAGHFALLVAASCLLYLSGMVLNDVRDAEVDAQERTERPIPSGRVSRTTAAAVGWAMLAGGVLVAWLVSLVAGDWRPGAVGALLAACVVLYDCVLKRTPLAPPVMGACRMLNVLLGMSLAPVAWSHAELLIAFGIGVYIAGVTMFARTEARASSRSQLLAGTIVLLAGIAIIASLPAWEEGKATLIVAPRGWHLLWMVLALTVMRRCMLAIIEPTPARVQAAVRNCVQSTIVLDAAVCVGLVSVFWGCAVLLLLAPTMLLAFWLDAT
ncbi:MAG: UbiA family prenyltransferase [Planctomycetes bacterium]|nr:UbiA family prenyltransferase [Planctomycetota bacterium]